MFTFGRDRNFYFFKFFFWGGGGFKAIPSVFLRISFYLKKNVLLGYLCFNLLVSYMTYIVDKIETIRFILSDFCIMENIANQFSVQDDFNIISLQLKTSFSKAIPTKI